MAKEINFIRPQEVYTPDTGEAKVRYRGYDGNLHDVELTENLAKDVAPMIEGKLLVATTWAELKALRDGGELVAGTFYHITDYNCTTTQENTQSAGHQFDIVLLALSANKLAEEGWAMMHDNIYDVTFSDGVTKRGYLYFFADNTDSNFVLVDTMLGVNLGLGKEDFTSIDEINKTAICGVTWSDLEEMLEENLPYNYFQNSNLSAWKVWYCLDNDTSRFAWADDSVDGGSPESINDDYFRSSEYDTDGKYAWDSNGDGSGLRYTDKETPEVGDTTYIYVKTNFMENGTVYSFTPAHEGTGLPNGRGVIYRLIDEFNNDVCYDFKNIQYIRPLDANGEYDPDNGTDTYVYTFNGWNGDNSVIQDNSLAFEGANNNKITAPFPDNFALPDVVSVTPMFSSSSSGSSNSTIIGSYNRFEHCEGLVVMADSSTFINCGDDTIGDGTQDPAIYINNKKVLTEE